MDVTSAASPILCAPSLVRIPALEPSPLPLLFHLPPLTPPPLIFAATVSAPTVGCGPYTEHVERVRLRAGRLRPSSQGPFARCFAEPLGAGSREPGVTLASALEATAVTAAVCIEPRVGGGRA